MTMQPPTGVRTLTNSERKTLYLYAIAGITIPLRPLTPRTKVHSRLIELGLLSTTAYPGRLVCTELGRRVAAEQGLR
jgi:hypothetical protein